MGTIIGLIVGTFVGTIFGFVLAVVLIMDDVHGEQIGGYYQPDNKRNRNE